MQKVWAGQGPMQKLGDLMVMLGTAPDSLCHSLGSVLLLAQPEPSLCSGAELSSVSASASQC